MDNSLRAIPHSRGISGATFAVRNGEFPPPTSTLNRTEQYAPTWQPTSSLCPLKKRLPLWVAS